MSGQELRTRTQEDQQETQPSNARKVLTRLGVTAAIIGTVVALASFSRTGMGSSDLSTPELVKANYQVDDAQHTRNMKFFGNDVVLSAGGKVHTCRGLTDDYLLSKKPLTCDDGFVIQPKP